MQQIIVARELVVFFKTTSIQIFTAGPRWAVINQLTYFSLSRARESFIYCHSNIRMLDQLEWLLIYIYHIIQPWY